MILFWMAFASFCTWGLTRIRHDDQLGRWNHKNGREWSWRPWDKQNEEKSK